MQQKFTQNEWKKAEYLELYGEVQTFNNSTLSQYKLSSNMNARSAASSNESAVTATATANAAPMQHYVEVGQLATAAYLIGTESVERVGEESDSNSTALVDSLFKSLTKNLNGTYTYSDTSLAKVAGLQADDIAFTFKIGDGTGTSNYTISSDENIFTARAYDSNGNSLAITENTKIDSHEVLLENFPTAAENVTSLSLDGIEDIANASMKDVFQKIFEIDDATEYNNRFYPLATNHGNDTAFTITFADGTTHTDGTASTTSVNFTYGDLVDGSNSFYAKIKNAVDNATKDISNISATTVDGSIIFSNAKIGADNKIDISVNFASDTFIGNTGYTASIYPEVISEENSVLKSDVPAKASDVFKTLLAIDEYGGTTTAAEYLKNYKDSYDIALSIQFTNTKNGVPKTGTADITFAQMASDDNFSDVIIHSLNAAGFDTDGGDADFTISVDATNGKLKITNSNYGDNNAIEFSINPVGIGDADHPYPTAIPETKIIPNQTIADWFDSINGDDFGFSEYMQRLREIRGDGRQGKIAFSVKIDDGEGYTNTIDFTYEDLADTGTKIGSRFKNLEGGNISIFTDTNEIKFTNNALGDYSKISLTLDIPPESEAYGFTLDTNGKINLQGYLDNAKLADFFSRLIDTEFTAQDKEAWKNDTNSAFKLSFVDANGATTDAIDISYKDLVTTTDGSLKTKLQEIVATNADKFGIRTETDADGVSNPRLVIFSSETGTGSSIKAVISDITMGTGNHMAGTATTNSFSINAGKVTEALNNKVKPYGTKINYTDSNIAFTVNFNDGLTTSSIDVQWKDIINGNLDNVLKKTPTTNKNNITWNTNHFENGRISPPNTILITTSTNTTSTVVQYTPKTTEVTNPTAISTEITPSQVTKTALEATEVKKTPISPISPLIITTGTLATTAVTWNSSYDSTNNKTTFTSTNYWNGTLTETIEGNSTTPPQKWFYELNGTKKDANGSSITTYSYTLPNNQTVTTDSDTDTIYALTNDNGNTYLTTSSVVYSYTDSTNTLQNSTVPVYSYPWLNHTEYTTDSSKLYSYTDLSNELKTSNGPVYSYTDSNGTKHTSTTKVYSYKLSGADTKTEYTTNDKALYEYSLNGKYETTDSNAPIHKYSWDDNDGKGKIERTNASKVYTYTNNDKTDTTTGKIYSFTRDGGTTTETTDTSTVTNVTGTTTITLSDIQDGLLTIGSAVTHYTDSAQAQQSAKNDLTTLFGNVEAGTTKDFTPHYKIINPGTSEDLNSRLIGNINTFLGASPQKGDGGYTPGEYATKLLNFFGGGTTEVNYNETSSTYSITQSGKNGIAKIDGVEHELTYPGTNTVEVKTTINGDSDASVLYYFKPDAEGQSGVAFSKNDVQEISVTYEQLANGYSFNDLVSDINNLGLNIRATYDSVQDRFSIYNKKSGSENEIRIGFDNLINTNALEYELTDIEGLTGDELKAAQTKNAAINESIAAAKAKNATIERTIQFFNDIGLKQTENGVLDKDYTFTSGKTSVLAGKNAVAKIDGVDYYGLDSNNVTVNGVNYTFNAVTNAIDENDSSTYDTITKDGKEIKVVKSDSSTPKVTVNITQDTASIAEKVKSFVEDYNTMLAKLYEWYDEKPNENYKPLTASQKEGMKEEQIEKWEEKAKAGLLYHDQNLYKVISDIRNSITEKVQGIDSDYDTIFSIGISTTGTKGQLKLDETKLNAALAADPDAVYNIFAKLDGGETQYLVEVNGTGTEIWSADPTYGRAVLDDEGNQQTKVENGVTLYLVEVKRKQIWTTNTSLGTVVTDSDGNPMTKTDDRYAYNGIANRLGNVLTNGMKNLRTVAGSSSSIDEDSDLNNLLRELQTKMSNFKRLMDAFESKLYKKYDAMESSLALLGAQLNYVTGAFQ